MVELVHIKGTGEYVPAEIQWRGHTLKLNPWCYSGDGILDYRIDGEGWFNGYWVATNSDCPKKPRRNKGAERPPRTWTATVGGGEAEGHKSALEALGAALEAHLGWLAKGERFLVKLRAFTKAVEGSG